MDLETQSASSALVPQSNSHVYRGFSLEHGGFWSASGASCTPLIATVPRFHIALLTFVAALSQAEAQASFDVPEPCGTREEFEAELARLLGAEASTVPPYTLAIVPSAAGGDYRLQMSLRGEAREVRDVDCRTLFKTAVVVVAASVKPELMQELPSATTAEAPPEPPPPAPPPPVPPPPAPPPPAAPAQPAPASTPIWRGGVALGGGLIAGLVPDVAPLFELGAVVEHASWGGALALRHATLSEAEAEDGRGVEVRSFGGRLAASYSPVGFLRVSLGAEVDLMLGRGTGVTTSLSDEAWSLAASGELAAILMEVDSLRLELAAQGRWALLRPRFQIAGFGDAYEVPQFGGGALLRVAYLLF